MSDDGHGAHHGPEHYIKIYLILLALFVVSVAGPIVADGLGSARIWVVLITAFGIAFVKAYLVCAKFMHLEIEKPIVRWILVTAVVFMVLFFAGTAPDVMKNEGTNWVKTAEIEWHQTSEAYRAKHGEDGHGAEGHSEEPADGEQH